VTEVVDSVSVESKEDSETAIVVVVVASGTPVETVVSENSEDDGSDVLVSVVAVITTS
jgi:hypothetical protein